MKKTITILLICLLLFGCQTNSKEKASDNNYLNLVETIAEHDISLFSETGSEYFNINGEVAKTNEGYRFYVTIDNPRYAMYGVEIIAVEKGVDYSLNMAANAGVFEGQDYNMLPGQANVDKGYVSGISVSSTTVKANPEIYVLVQWYSKKQDIHQEFIKLNLKYEGA